MNKRAAQALALCALSWPSMAEIQAPKLRLPTNVQPVRYEADLHITPGQDHFQGSIDITLNVRQAAPVLWLHAKALQFQEASIRSSAGAQPAKIEPASDDFIAVTVEGGFAPGPAVLHISYSGEVSRKLTDGAFQQREGNDWYVFTKFEPITARRVFPCFDEPSFKVPWQLTLHFPAGLRAFSNTPALSEENESGGRVVRFAETRPLPSYLIAFAIGPFDVVETRPVGRNHAPSRIIVPKGRAAEAAYAAEMTPEFIGLLESYFGTSYPYRKLDQIVVPITTAWGAMENAGLIAYGQFLLNPKGTDTQQRQERCSNTMLHEMSHQWFGDLVTTAWWDDIWLNESFASWLAAKLVEQWRPEWQSALNAAAATSVMEADTFVSARKIRQPIVVPGDIGSAFDAITYGKGSAVIAMFEHYAGPEPFRQAVQLYLRRHAWGNATATDLLDALDAVAGPEKGAAFSGFLNQGGFPLIRAGVQCSGGKPILQLKQERFLPLGSEGKEGELWSVPVSVRWSGSSGIRTKTVLLSRASEEFPLDGAGCPDWIFADADAAGYYTVIYEGDWRRKPLERGWEHLSPLERATAVRNMQVLLTAGKGDIADTLETAAKLAADDEPEIVRQSAALLAGVHDAVPPGLLPRYREFMQSRFGRKAHELGWTPAREDSQITRLLRNQLVLWMATRGQDAALQAEAHALALRWLAGHRELDPDSVTPVLQAAAWSGDRAFYEKLVAEIRSSKMQRERRWMIGALPWFRDSSITRSSLGLLFEPGIDPRELQPLLFNAQPDARPVVWEFVKANFDRLNSTLPGARGIPFGAILPRAAAGFCDAQSAADVEAFFRGRIAGLSGGPRNLANALEHIRLCAARTEALRPVLAAFLEDRRN